MTGIGGKPGGGAFGDGAFGGGNGITGGGGEGGDGAMALGQQFEFLYIPFKVLHVINVWSFSHCGHTNVRFRKDCVQHSLSLYVCFTRLQFKFGKYWDCATALEMKTSRRSARMRAWLTRVTYFFIECFR